MYSSGVCEQSDHGYPLHHGRFNPLLNPCPLYLPRATPPWSMAIYDRVHLDPEILTNNHLRLNLILDLL
jgi:hypothetical protein